MELFRDRKNDRKKFMDRRPKRKKSAIQKAGDLLPEFFSDNPGALRKLEENKALNAWARYVGDSGALVSQALRVRGNELIVQVDDPLWMHQFILVKRDLIRRYQTDFPRLQIKDIFFTRQGKKYDK